MEGCKLCKIICQITKGKGSGLHKVAVELEAGWILNHCNSKDRNYFGRLVLTPKRHLKDFEDLNEKEAKALGLYISQINRALKKYWADNFADKVDRIYVIYFHETPFKHSLTSEESRSEEHMHIHLFPRTKDMLFSKDPIKVAAWELVHLLDAGFLPNKYKLFNRQGKTTPKMKRKLEDLMKFLKNNLPNSQLIGETSHD